MAARRHKKARGRIKTNASAKKLIGDHRFGGRGTALGVRYESHVAAFVAVQMLAGNSERIWDWASGDEVRSIALQTRDYVDDLLIERRGTIRSRAYVQAKGWNKAISVVPTNKAFTEPIAAFVQQFLSLNNSERELCLLVWVVSSNMGSALTRDLAELLDTHRLNAPDGPLRDFVRNRSNRHQTIFDNLSKTVKSAWRKNGGRLPSEGEFRAFLRVLRVEINDFGQGNHDERDAMRIIRRNVSALISDDKRIWERLESIFHEADEKGLTVTPASLRRNLTMAGFMLKASPGYSQDIEVLQKITKRNLVRLRAHSVLRFSSGPGQDIHIRRPAEQANFLKAVNAGHCLLTGEPGCGKSGLIHWVVQTLLSENVPVVLLLAEEVFHTNSSEGNIPGLQHPLDEIFAHWPDGGRGILITDALDAVRETETLKKLRSLLRDVLSGESGWLVAASVREFDLKHGRELKDLFPGRGFPGYEHADFEATSHFHLKGLRDDEVSWLTEQRPQIKPFVESANQNPKSRGLQRSPFYLRLAAELLGSGVSPSRLADWNSPALLLRSFWERRLEEGPGIDYDKAALQKICRQMVLLKNPTVSAQALCLTAADQKAIRNLRSKGILQSPVTRFGTTVGADSIRFSHHLLHDYAITRTLIPLPSDQFCKFANRDRLLPVFYRQSFIFALEEIWDMDVTREAYWETAIRLQSIPTLYGITRITAPVHAARRVEVFGDLSYFLKRILESGMIVGSGPAVALQHLASGLQDSDPDVIRIGGEAWCEFAVQLSRMLDTHPPVEASLVHFVARLDSVKAASAKTANLNLNIASRSLLAGHLKKQVNRGWNYLAIVAIEGICHTFASAPRESEALLLEMMTDNRVSQFPQEELFRLSHHIQYLINGGEKVILRLFECAFGFRPEPGQWQQFGTMIMPMQIQSRDRWHSIQYSLANFFVTLNSENVELTTGAACLVANSCVRSIESRYGEPPQDAPLVQFRNRTCALIEDMSSHSARGRFSIHYEEDRVIAHFESLLEIWCKARDSDRISSMLDIFAEKNRSALLWSVLFNLGATHPQTLGYLFLPIIAETKFFTCRDYSHAATRLLGALHGHGDAATREKLETFILDLPALADLWLEESRTPTPPRLEYVQNRLLGTLQAANIVLQPVRDLFFERHAANVIVPNSPPERVSVISHEYTEDEALERRGIHVQDSTNRKLVELSKALQTSFPDDKAQFDLKLVPDKWRTIGNAERMLNRYGETHKAAARDLWGHLVIACRNILANAEWHKDSERWLTVRRVVLRAANDPLPGEDAGDSDPNSPFPVWSFPSPRIEAAHALPMLVFRRDRIDRSIEKALWGLSRDKSYPVRFHFAESLSPLWQRAPALLWKIIDSMIHGETIFCVLDNLTTSLDWLSVRNRDEALPRIIAIARRASVEAKADHRIHQQLAVTLVFGFIRTGDPRCETIVKSLITKCDTEVGHNALASVLHNLRVGRWLTVSARAENPDADAVRGRAWQFALDLAESAQCKVEERRQNWERFGPLTGDAQTEHAAALGAAIRTMDSIAGQLYFLTGAFDEKGLNTSNDYEHLTPPQLKRLWQEAEPVFRVLVKCEHPHTAYELIQTLNHLLPTAPRDIFLLATKSIQSSSSIGFLREPLAVPEVVKLIQHALADFRELFQSSNGNSSECLDALLAVLDMFVEAGWPEARQLTHRLEEIYR
jgi:hypothetical protein